MSPFADLHTGPEPLLLPNAWDVASALVFADAGFPAVGTTSMGVSASAGHPDGRRGSREMTLRLAEALEVVDVHVSVDVEDGYADDPSEVAELVDALPVAGLNIEDSSNDRLVAPARLADKVAAVKQRRPDVFVNVRVDTFWLGQDATEETTLARAAAYVAAGADGVFVPGVTDLDVIERLAGGLDVPLNVLAVPGSSLADLGRLGVRRVSTGSLPYRVALQAALDTAEAVRTGGGLPGAVTYPALQDSLSTYARSQVPPTP
jgi:2-methylisocitrate lyase-like PEP mutase family enzyme